MPPCAPRPRGHRAGSTWSGADAQGAWFRSGFRHHGPAGSWARETRQRGGGGGRPRGSLGGTGLLACLCLGARQLGGGCAADASAWLPPRGHLGNRRRQQPEAQVLSRAEGQATPPYTEALDRNTDNTSVRQKQNQRLDAQSSPRGLKQTDKGKVLRHAGQMDKPPAASTQANDNQGKVTSLYWLSLRLDQQWLQAQVDSGWESVDNQCRRLQQWPWVSGICGSSSIGPPVDRCPGERMAHVKPGPELSSLHWAPSLDGELTPRLLPTRSPPSPVALLQHVLQWEMAGASPP